MSSVTNAKSAMYRSRVGMAGAIREARLVGAARTRLQPEVG